MSYWEHLFAERKKARSDNSSGGFLSVDRDHALKENWEMIMNMQRPATAPAEKSKPSKNVSLTEAMYKLSRQGQTVVLSRDGTPGMLRVTVGADDHAHLGTPFGTMDDLSKELLRYLCGKLPVE
jgi:hypothetical protein